MIIHKPSLGLCEVRHKIWPRSLQPRFDVIGHKRTDKQTSKVYIETFQFKYKFKSNLDFISDIFKPSQPHIVWFTFPVTSPTANTAGRFVAWNSSVIIFPASSSSIPAYTEYIYTAWRFVAWNWSVIIFPASSSSIPAYTVHIYSRKVCSSIPAYIDQIKSNYIFSHKIYM